MRLIEPRGPVRLRLAAIGDVGIVGAARARARQEGYDRLFAPAAPAFAAADLAFANLEFPVGEPSWVRPGRSPEFWHEPEVVAALARAGVRVVSIANNHAMDCGPRGLERTREACAAAGIAAIGAGADLDHARAPAWFTLGAERVLLLGYAATAGDEARPGVPGLAPLDANVIREDLERWGGEASLRVVSVHWGSMYVDFPPPRVLELARALGEAGVDLVLGHHPHLLQGWEVHGRALTLYSLGDGAFNCHAGDFHASIAATVRLDSGVFTALLGEGPGLDYAPYRLDPDGVPAPVTAGEGERQAERLRRLSAAMSDAPGRFAREGAPALLRYQLEALGAHVRHGRLDRIVAMLGSLRPRHLPLLLQAVRRAGRSS